MTDKRFSLVPSVGLAASGAADQRDTPSSAITTTGRESANKCISCSHSSSHRVQGGEIDTNGR